MIENIRKYTGLMIVVFVVLFISFLLIDTSSVQNIGGGGAMLRVDGKTYTQKEFSRVGQNGYELTQELIRGGNFDLYQFLIASTIDATDDNDSVEKFFITRMLLRAAADEFGLRPAESEISAYIRGLQSFAGPDGGFDAQAFGAFVERRIGRLGMTEADVRSLVSDILIYNKLSDVVGSGMAPLAAAIERIDAFQSQLISGALAHFALAPFEAAVEPSEDDVLAFWENLQDAFMTEPRRRFTYVFAKPDLPEEISSEEEALPELSFQDLALSEEERAERDAKFQAERAAERAELRRKLQLETDAKIDDFLYDLENKQGATFESLAGEMGLDVVTTDWFTQSDPPLDLAQPLRQSGRGESVAGELFRMIPTEDPLSKISHPLAVADGGWVVARLDEVEPSRVKTFEEAREEARALYIEEKAVAAMRDAAANAKEKIQEAIKAGKSFAEAAEEAGLMEVHVFENVTSTQQAVSAEEPQSLFESVRAAAPGSVAEVIIERDRAFIVFVEKRELLREENLAQRVEAQVAQTTRANESTAFIAWLRARTEAANVQQLYRR